MLLEYDDLEQFYELHHSLLGYVNARLGLYDVPSDAPDPYGLLSSAESVKVHGALWQDRDKLIGAYTKDNPSGFGPERLDEIHAWKAAVTDEFIVFRQLKNYVVMMPASGRPTAYGVVGLRKPIPDILPYRLPVLCATTLLPFRGQIVYDGVILSQRVRFGGGYKARMNQAYRQAKADRGIILSLGGQPAAALKKKHTAPKDRAGLLVAKLRKKLADLRGRRHLIKNFQDTVLPAFQKWAEEAFKDERAARSNLAREIEDLEEAIDLMESTWRSRAFPTRRAAAESALEDLEEKRQRRSDRAAHPDAGDDFDEDGDEDDQDHDDEGTGGKEVVDELFDLMFALFMAEAHGIDVNEMSERDRKEARAKFSESIGHAARDDHAAFEQSLFEAGADRSEENVGAVKKLFRRLARSLHPDRNPCFGDEAKELWEELGAAKKALDVPAMERIEIHWQIVRGEEFPPKSERRLKVFQRHLDDQLIEIRETVAELESHPLWGHDTKEVPPEVEASLRAQEKRAIAALLRQKAKLEAEIERFRREPARTPKKKRRMKQPARK
ncbi:hypothetical protein BH23VER1_BH23VER1_20370 [soil metagenome]